MQLTDEELEEQIALVDFKVGSYTSSSSESEAMVRNQAVLQAEKQRRGKVATHRAERQERQKTEKKVVKFGAKLALYGGPVLGALGVGPIAGTFLYEAGQGFIEGLDEQPEDQKEALKQKFYDLYFKFGNWDDKWEYTKGYLLGIVEGVWGEIRGIYDFFKMLYDLNKKVNDWIISTGVSLFTNWRDVEAKGQSIRARVSKAIEAVYTEVSDFIKDPAEGMKKLKSMLDSLLGSALDQANDLGHDAAAKVFKFLQEPFFELGEDVGKVVGALIFNIVLLVASDAIGNLIKEGASILVKVGKFLLEGVVDFVKGIGSFIAKAWEIVGRFGKKFLSGEAFESLGKAIGEFVEWLKGLVPKVEPQLASASGAPISGIEEAKAATTVESRAATRGTKGGYKPSDYTPPKVHPSKAFETPVTPKEAEKAVEEGLKGVETEPLKGKEARRALAAAKKGTAAGEKTTKGLEEAVDVAKGTVRREAGLTSTTRGTRIGAEAEAELISKPPIKGDLLTEKYFREMPNFPPEFKDKTVAQFLRERPELDYIKKGLDPDMLSKKVGDLRMDVFLQAEEGAPTVVDITAGGYKRVPKGYSGSTLTPGTLGPGLGEIHTAHGAKSLLYVQILSEMFPGEIIQMGETFWDFRRIVK